MTDIYRALSDGTRRKILGLLGQGEMTQQQIVRQFNMSQPAITKHLKILKEEGLISERQEGKFRFYSLNRTEFESAYTSMKLEIEQVLDNKLSRLKRHLETKEES